MITNLKRLTVAALILFNFNAKAQLVIKAGLTSSDISLKNNAGDLDQLNEMKQGVHFGLFMEKKINSLLSYETGLMFDQKGMKMANDLGSGNIQTDIMSIAYLKLPMALKVGIDVTPSVRLFGKLGGYGGYGLSGKIDTEVVNAGTVTSTTETDLNIGTDVSAGDLVKPIDYGAEFGVGLQYKQIMFEVNFEQGLANIATDQSAGEVFKNKELKFTLGYRFGK